MGYTILQKDGQPAPIRLIGDDGQILAPVTVPWRCDPCARSDRRISVEWPAGETCYPWNRVILPDDDPNTVRAKVLRTQRELVSDATLRLIRDHLVHGRWDAARKTVTNMQEVCEGWGEVCPEE